MKNFKGVYINLEESKVRRENVKRQLLELGIERAYRRFSAIKGNEEEAKKRGLSNGELGLWKSWISLLKEESETEDEYEYLHIAEDDIILSKAFKICLGKIEKDSDPFDIIATDMYVNPSIYSAWNKLHMKALEKKKFGLKEGKYTGCTSSLIIKRENIKKILEILRKEFDSNNQLIPLDNFLVRLNEQDKIKIGRTVPFLTFVMGEKQCRSTIQNHVNEEESIKLTRDICFYLRKQLSIFRETKDTFILLNKLVDLTSLDSKTNNAKQAQEIFEKALKLAEQEKIFKYQWRPKLKDEPLNRQYAKQTPREI